MKDVQTFLEVLFYYMQKTCTKANIPEDRDGRIDRQTLNRCMRHLTRHLFGSLKEDVPSKRSLLQAINNPYSWIATAVICLAYEEENDLFDHILMIRKGNEGVHDYLAWHYVYSGKDLGSLLRKNGRWEDYLALRKDKVHYGAEHDFICEIRRAIARRELPLAVVA